MRCMKARPRENKARAHKLGANSNELARKAHKAGRGSAMSRDIRENRSTRQGKFSGGRGCR